MKNFMLFEKVAKERINDEEKLEKTLDIAKCMIFARVENARIYAYCKTGQYSKKRATQEWHDAVREFNLEHRGH